MLGSLTKYHFVQYLIGFIVYKILVHRSKTIQEKAVEKQEAAILEKKIIASKKNNAKDWSKNS